MGFKTKSYRAAFFGASIAGMSSGQNSFKLKYEGVVKKKIAPLQQETEDLTDDGHPGEDGACSQDV